MKFHGEEVLKPTSHHDDFRLLSSSVKFRVEVSTLCLRAHTTHRILRSHSSSTTGSSTTCEPGGAIVSLANKSLGAVKPHNLLAVH